MKLKPKKEVDTYVSFNKRNSDLFNLPVVFCESPVAAPVSKTSVASHKQKVDERKASVASTSSTKQKVDERKASVASKSSKSSTKQNVEERTPPKTYFFDFSNVNMLEKSSSDKSASPGQKSQMSSRRLTLCLCTPEKPEKQPESNQKCTRDSEPP